MLETSTAGNWERRALRREACLLYGVKTAMDCCSSDCGSLVSLIVVVIVAADPAVVDGGVGFEQSSLQISKQRSACPLLLLDFCPMSSGASQFTKSILACPPFWVPRAGGHGYLDAGRGRAVVEMPVWSLLS